MFQSTLPRGERPSHSPLKRQVIQVSIHAPAWGATPIRPPMIPVSSRFNPRSRVGSDRVNKFACYGTSRFNPRSRVGSDIDDNITAAILVVSIHAPAWGATWHIFPIHSIDDVSIHAPAWGATGDENWTCGFESVSIHAPAWGATILQRNTRGGFIVSIHAPAWGATFLARLYSFVQLVSIHAPAWGATEPLCCFLLD